MLDLRQLGVVIPSYNARELLCRALDTLLAAAPEADVVVVDGGSADGSAQAVRDGYPGVRLVEVANHGWGHATNRGIAATDRPYLLFMNSDAFVDREGLLTMLERLQSDSKLGAAAPVLLNEDGSRQKVFGLWYGPHWSRMRRPRGTRVLSAACLMTRRDVVERVGGIDENLFFYNEEYDWCHRVRGAGYRLEVLPPRVVHVGGGSTRPSAALQYETYRGFLYVARKNYGQAFYQAARVIVCGYSATMAWLDREQERRDMWSRLRSVALRERYEESAFPLSGRGEVRFGPMPPMPSAESPRLRHSLVQSS